MRRRGAGTGVDGIVEGGSGWLSLSLVLYRKQAKVKTVARHQVNVLVIFAGMCREIQKNDVKRKTDWKDIIV